MIARMGLQEFHPFLESEIARAPEAAGVYVLLQVQIPIHVAGAANLRMRLREEKKKFPQATHFAVEMHASEEQIRARLEQLNKQLGGVRNKGFVGS